MQQRFKRIAIKVGSNVLTKKDGTLDFTRMSAIVDQISELHKSGVEVVLISSGAVAAGKNKVLADTLDAVSQRQLFSAIGQVKLINRYYMLFRDNGITCGQVLTTKESFHTRQHYLNQRNCMQVMIENGVIPIVNENDTISLTELMFTDNDELSGLVATMIDAQALIILSNIDGIFNGNPADPESQVIRRVLPGERDLSQYLQTSKSSLGRGGMQSKMGIASKVADEGVEVIIANGKRDNIILDLLDDTKDIVCTRFLPDEQVSSVKKWIAHSEGFCKGEIKIDNGAEKAIIADERCSILPIGVKSVSGSFEKGDIVRVVSESGEQIALGKTDYSSAEATDMIGKKGEKPIIHCDYLYVL